MFLFGSKSEKKHHQQHQHQKEHEKQHGEERQEHDQEQDQHAEEETMSMTKNDPVASASQAAGTAWLSGHLYHLTDDQEQRFKEFKKLCEEKGYYKPSSSSSSSSSGGQGRGQEEGERGDASHDDATLLRFLRARKFDVDAAWDQFRDTEDWRKDNAIEALYENIDVNSYESSRRMYPQWTGRRDRRGIPVYVFEIKHLNKENMAAYNATISHTTTAETHKSSSIPARLLRLFALYENLLRFVMPLCSKLPRPNPETPIVSSNNIVDISGVGLKQFWNLKGHMQDASILATAHYPETLDRIFIIGAPSFFPTVWSWIKRWFDPVTTSKIFILTASEVKPTLTSFMEPSSIPKQYGGELDWKWGDMPVLDDPAREQIGALETPPADVRGADTSRFVKGPVLFSGDRIEVLGTMNGKKRRETILVPTGNKHDTKSQSQSQNQNSDNDDGVESATTVVASPETETDTANKSATLEGQVYNGDTGVSQQRQQQTAA